MVSTLARLVLELVKPVAICAVVKDARHAATVAVPRAVTTVEERDFVQNGVQLVRMVDMSIHAASSAAAQGHVTCALVEKLSVIAVTAMVTYVAIHVTALANIFIDSGSVPRQQRKFNGIGITILFLLGYQNSLNIK